MRELLTNDRTRFPYTYIGMEARRHTAWHAPRINNETVGLGDDEDAVHEKGRTVDDKICAAWARAERAKYQKG